MCEITQGKCGRITYWFLRLQGLHYYVLYKLKILRVLWKMQCTSKGLKSVAKAPSSLSFLLHWGCACFRGGRWGCGTMDVYCTFLNIFLVLEKIPRSNKGKLNNISHKKSITALHCILMPALKNYWYTQYLPFNFPSNFQRI